MLIAGYVVYYFYNRKKQNKTGAAHRKKAKGDIPTQQVRVEKEELSGEEKGNAFETYIVSKFSRQYFTHNEWRSDKYKDGFYAKSNMQLDLEYTYKPKKINFAVECKFRKSFFNGQIEWAKEHQLKNYREFEREKNMKVFVVIGIGGTADNPATLYIIPLTAINTIALSAKELAKYKRYRTGDFFLYTENDVKELL